MAGFHLLVYQVTSAAAAVDLDMNAVTDPVFTQRNSHITLTDPIVLLAAQYLSLNASRANIRSPTWLAQTIFNIDPVSVGATQLSPPRVTEYWNFLPVIPQYEEISVKASDTLAAGNNLTAALWVGTQDWNRNLPRGIGPLSIFCARVTATAALVANGFSTLATLTFEQGLRAGVYAVVGSHWYVATALYHRLQFPRSTLYNGRAMRPGDVVAQTVGDLPWCAPPERNYPFGVWGRFHTYETPQVEFYSPSAVASATYEGRLWLVKLNENPDPGSLGA